MTEHLTGGCLCGAVRYETKTEETLHYLCHCSDCQRWGGAPYHAAIVVAADDLTVTGEPRVWTKRADSGREIARYFCGECGGHLFTSPWPEATRFSLKAGALDDREAFAPSTEIWRRSRVSWADRSADAELFEQSHTRPISIGAKSAE